MSYSVKINDETTTGQVKTSIVLEFPAEMVTVREIIRSRIYQEVKDFNAQPTGVYPGLIQPKESEQILNGFRLKTPRQIDWRDQLARAVQAFEKNQLVILIGEKQVESLDQEHRIRPTTEVSFLRLIPLVGG